MLMAGRLSLPGWSSLLSTATQLCHACLTLMQSLVGAHVSLVAPSETVFDDWGDSSIWNWSTSPTSRSLLCGRALHKLLLSVARHAKAEADLTVAVQFNSHCRCLPDEPLVIPLSDMIMRSACPR